MIGRQRRPASPPVVALDEWAYWNRHDTKGAGRAVRAARPAPAGPRVAVVGRRGRSGKGSGQAASLPLPSVWRATTATAAGIYPWLVAEPVVLSTSSVPARTSVGPV